MACLQWYVQCFYMMGSSKSTRVRYCAMILRWFQYHREIFRSIIIWWDHCYICSLSFMETSLCRACLYIKSESIHFIELWQVHSEPFYKRLKWKTEGRVVVGITFWSPDHLLKGEPNQSQPVSSMSQVLCSQGSISENYCLGLSLTKIKS